MKGIGEIDRFVIGAGAEAVGAVEHDEARGGQQAGEAEHLAKLRPLPLANRAPTLDAVVPGDLGALRHGAERGERQG